MSRRVPLRLSSSAVIGAGIALVAGGAGFALAGIPDSKGVIHACYSKTDGALRVVKGSKCQSGEKKLKWNQQGRPGATNVKVRSANVRLKYSCFQITPSNYSCTAPATVVQPTASARSARPVAATANQRTARLQPSPRASRRRRPAHRRRGP